MQGPYFLGETLSMVDLAFIPFLERTAASLAYYKGFYIRGKREFPGVEAWFDAMETRTTYLGTRSDYYTHCHDLPPQLGGASICACLYAYV
jgi:glutathione S-transferase